MQFGAKGYSVKEFLMNILNGSAIGIVTVLIPGALLSLPLRLLAPYWQGAQLLMQGTLVSNAVMGMAVGVITATFFRFTPIQMASVGLATVFAGGVAKAGAGGKGLMLVGTGDIITMWITTAIAVALILWIGEKVKSYTILVIPALTLFVAGGIGATIYPYVTMITHYVGMVVEACITLQPLLMCILIAVLYAFLIMSPISPVGIALAISLSGIGSGAGNLGVCAAAFGFCIGGWRVNSIGTCLAHWIGSPKISMANFIAKPRTMLPIICTAIIMGACAAVFNVKGVPMSAGFGFSGFVGPVAALDNSSTGWTAMNTVFLFCLFSVVPAVLSYAFNYIFMDVLKLVKPEDYKLEIR